MSEYILEMQKITKEFPGVKALDNVDVKVKQGEIHALVGENGAGKSTLMKVLSGVYPHGSYSGDIVYKGQKAQFRNTRDSENVGIAIIHQELALSPYLSITENVFLGNELTNGIWIRKFEQIKKTQELMDVVDLRESPNEIVENLGVGKQQLVEICKALNKKVELLILDEPTAALNDEESDKLLNLLLEFKKQGMSSIIITHKLKEVTKVADSVTVIRDGQSIETIDAHKEELSEDRIVKSMVGRELSNRFPPRERQIGEVFFEVKNWNVDHPVHDGRRICKNIGLNVRMGEVVGIAGLMGAGRTEFAMSVFGESYGRNIHGEVYMDGRQIKLKSPDEAIRNGIAYVSEDRKQYGLILINDIKDNISLASLDSVCSHGVLNKLQVIKDAEEYRKTLNIKTPSVFQKLENLSGGNQQKVVLAKWLKADPRLLILDEPTRGIDVGAKYEIYQLINDIVKDGERGLLVISSELEELLGICDRIYVLNEGEVKGELDISEASQESIMQMIVRD